MLAVIAAGLGWLVFGVILRSARRSDAKRAV
jgi:hypothetical protein